MTKQVNDDIRFRVMRELEGNPELSQRELAKSLGISLGIVNYCLKALVEKGQVKVQNFRASDNKLRYAYVMTPQGLSAKAALTARFLKRRVAEYEALKAEIEALESQVATDAGSASRSN
ncbi:MULTISPECIES: MarR family EPS-associated transcriptional regulator [unclassified Marinovum]|uniref:MarR family EPS-associated transcriptional regulator n=1 Tax=unclassified Marinovum TaxID=2647166 RepID=UPI003EDCA859